MDAELKRTCDKWLRDLTVQGVSISGRWILLRKKSQHEINFWSCVARGESPVLRSVVFNEVMDYLKIPIQYIGLYDESTNSVLVNTPWGARRVEVFAKLETLLNPHATEEELMGILDPNYD